MATDPHALTDEAGSGWEAALSARGRAAAWSPWWQGELPPPPVEPIMLTGGIPDPDSLPIDELIACNERVLRREGTFALAYGGPQGYPGLAEWLARRINAREGLNLGPQNFVITCGAAGGLENLVETFLDPGDVAIVERPTFPGSLRTIKSCLPEVVGVDVDEHGLLPDQLEEAIARAEAAGKRRAEQAQAQHGRCRARQNQAVRTLYSRHARTRRISIRYPRSAAKPRAATVITTANIAS